MRKALCMIPAVMVLLGVGHGYSNPNHDNIRPPSHLSQMLAFGGVRLGVVVSEINRHIRQGLKIDSGVLVEEVLKDSPAEAAGIREGDIILAVGTQTVNSQKDIRDALQNLKGNESVDLQILRDGAPVTMQVKPERNELKNIIRFGNRNYLGVQLQEFDSDLAAYFKVDPKDGVLVTAVEPESPASQGGIRSGDVITHFNGKKVTSPEEVRKELEDINEGQSVEITLLRQGVVKKVEVKPEIHSFHGEMMKDLPNVMAFTHNPEFQAEMDNLKNQMEDMKRDLQLKQKDIDDLKAEIEKDMQSLKKQLQKQ
jgi:C-terminal processing protease CtpA/Prc